MCDVKLVTTLHRGKVPDFVAANVLDKHVNTDPHDCHVASGVPGAVPYNDESYSFPI